MNLERRTLLKSSAYLVSGLLSARNTLVQAMPQNQPRTMTLSEKNPLLLNYNENSLGMSPAAIDAIMNNLSTSHRYPDNAIETLTEQLAHYHAQAANKILLTNGSSAAIQAAILMAIQQANQQQQAIQLLVPNPTFNYAELYCQPYDVQVNQVALTSDLRFDIPQLQYQADNFAGFSIVYLCNPNNPTATITANEQLAAWIAASEPQKTLFIIDEAYAEYVSDPAFKSAIKLTDRYPHVFVTRTFSKIYALAGLRVGYAIAHADLLAKVKPFTVIDSMNLLGMVAASASLKDKDFLARSINNTNEARLIVTNAFDELQIEYHPSQANFIFHRIKGSNSEYQQRMQQQHVYVGREFPPLSGWNRLTLGTPQEMQQFVNIAKEFKEKAWL